MRPVYEVRISGDIEDAPDTTAEETLSRPPDGSVVWHVTRAGFERAGPFLFGGAGYLRELHEDDALVEEGLEYHAGGGIKWWFGQGRRRVGVRGEAGISIRDGGFDFGWPTHRPDSRRVLFYTFRVGAGRGRDAVRHDGTASAKARRCRSHRARRTPDTSFRIKAVVHS